MDLGLDVAITELDVNMGGEPNATALEQQARDFWTVASACFEVEGCVSFVSCLFFRYFSGAYPPMHCPPLLLRLR